MARADQTEPGVNGAHSKPLRRAASPRILAQLQCTKNYRTTQQGAKAKVRGKKGLKNVKQKASRFYPANTGLPQPGVKPGSAGVKLLGLILCVFE